MSTVDGEISKDADGYWIEFQRLLNHPIEAAYAALTEPRRLAIWEHPVEYFPDLREGATIYAHLNPQVNAIALGKLTQVQPPTGFAFRWTTNNPMLPPDFSLAYALRQQGDTSELRVRSGPFGPGPGIVMLTASMHIHLDHLDEAIATPADQLPDAPWPEVSVVTRSGRMKTMADEYVDKFRAQYPELVTRPSGRHPMQKD